MTQLEHKFLASFSVRVGTKRHRVELEEYDGDTYRIRINRRYHETTLGSYQVARMVVDMALGENTSHPMPEDYRKYTRCSVYFEEDEIFSWYDCQIWSAPVQLYDGRWYVFVSAIKPVGRRFVRCDDIKIKAR